MVPVGGLSVAVCALSDPQSSLPLKSSPLDGLHRALGAQMVGFAGWSLPLRYPAGIIAEHRHTRAAASLFDVSHMGQATILGAHELVAPALEALVPGDIAGLAPGRSRYSMLLNEGGGVIDDLIISRVADGLRLVVNGARQAVDAAHLTLMLAARPPAPPIVWHDRALLAVQGPAAATVLARLGADIDGLGFMAVRDMRVSGFDVWGARCGYAGEDGFELSVPVTDAESLARRLLDEPEMAPAGLGARDSLRLEAGLCLYGQDLDETVTPVEAGLAWVIGKSRRLAWDFPGGEVLRAQLAKGPARRLVGVLVDGRAPVRAGAEVIHAGEAVGRVTSGVFSPTLERPIALALLRADHADPGSDVSILLRGREVAAQVVALPFVAHRYRTGGAG